MPVCHKWLRYEAFAVIPQEGAEVVVELPGVRRGAAVGDGE